MKIFIFTQSPFLLVDFLASLWLIVFFQCMKWSLIHCFCAFNVIRKDFNKNDGTPGREYFAPKSLMKFMTEDANDGAESTPLRSIHTADLKSEPKTPAEEVLIAEKLEYQTQQEMPTEESQQDEEKQEENETAKEKGDM